MAEGLLMLFPVWDRAVAQKTPTVTAKKLGSRAYDQLPTLTRLFERTGSSHELMGMYRVTCLIGVCESDMFG